MTRHRPTRGFSLLEVLMALSIGAVLVAGAAAHFRTLRQASELTSSRHESLQNARVAFERIARQIRTAKQITAISDPSDAAGSISLVDPSGLTHIFALQGSDLLYGNAAATDLLASGVQALTFQGYNKLGTVPAGQPGDISAVEIALTPALPSAARTSGAAVSVATLTTRARIGRELATYAPRSHTACGTVYALTTGAGLSNSAAGLGEPDALYAECFDNSGGRYSGFAHGPHYGIVRNLYAGIRMLHVGGSVQVIIRHESNKIFDRTYGVADLASVHDVWGWWWLDLTLLRTQWLDSDLPLLSIEVRDPGPGTTQARFDAFRILACFDPAQTTTLLANSTGGGTCPSEWDNPTRAFGAADDFFAVGHFFGDKRQSYAFDVPDCTDEITAVRLRIEGYVSLLLVASTIEVRAEPAAAPLDSGTLHVLSPSDLANRVGYLNRGTITVDLTNDRTWTWDGLRALEARFRLRNRDLIPPDFVVDSVSLQVVRRGPVERGIVAWSEP